MTSFVSLTDSGSFDDELPGANLPEVGTFDDELLAAIVGGPTIPVTIDDVDGATDVEASFAVDGMFVFMLDFVEGSSDVEISYVGPIYTVLDIIDGSTLVHVSVRSQLYVTPDPVDGATDFELSLNPYDPSQNVLGVAGAQLNTAIGVAVILTGRLAVLPPVAIV